MKLIEPTKDTRFFRRYRQRMLVAACLAVLTACSVGPDYVRPEVPPPAAWNDAQNNNAPAWPSAEWWHGFASPTLDSFIEKARDTNDDIAASVARVREADAQAAIAGAPLLPAVNATASATNERQPATTGMKTYSQFVPLLNASYELDFWGKNRAALESAEATASASRYDKETIELTVETSVANDYFQALGLCDRLKIAEDNLKSAHDILSGLRAEEKIGIATSLDVAQQEVVVATLSAAVPPLRQQLRQTSNALAILTGQNPEIVDISTGSLQQLSAPELRAGLPSELLTRRPDVAEAEEQLIAANANIKVARAQFFPSIDLTASGGFESAALATALNPANGVFALTAGITQPIFEGGALEGQYDYTEARYDELLANYHKTVISAFGNVEDALVALRQTEEQLQRQQETADKAQLAYNLANTQFQAGTINILTVLNTEGALFTARDGLAQVKLLHLQALLGLYNALGGGWQKTQESTS